MIVCTSNSGRPVVKLTIHSSTYTIPHSHYDHENAKIYINDLVIHPCLQNVFL